MSGQLRISRAAFVAMWNDPTVTTDEIAARFGMHRSSVTPYGQRLKLPPRKGGAKPKVCREAFTALWLAKVGTAEIARSLGVSRNYTGLLARSYGLPPRRQGARDNISLEDYRQLQLREALAVSARETEAALILSEMVDGFRDPGKTRRAA